MAAAPSNGGAKRRPDNKPFDFDLDAVKAEVELTPWVMRYCGQRWTLKHMQELNVWNLVAAAEAGELEAGLQTFKAALGEKQFEEFKKLELPQYKLEAMFEGWQKHCGVEPGESEGSTSS